MSKDFSANETIGWVLASHAVTFALLSLCMLPLLFGPLSIAVGIGGLAAGYRQHAIRMTSIFGIGLASIGIGVWIALSTRGL